MSEEQVLEALRALAEADAAREAPADVEARLRARFRWRGRRRARWVAAASVLAAAAAIGTVVVLTHRTPRAEPAPQSREVVTDFFPLMDPAPPLGRGQLLRVELPASAMQMVGLPVREERLADPVEADVLLGEEGLPRAIRFVSFAVK